MVGGCTSLLLLGLGPELRLIKTSIGEIQSESSSRKALWSAVGAVSQLLWSLPQLLAGASLQGSLPGAPVSAQNEKDTEGHALLSTRQEMFLSRRPRSFGCRQTVSHCLDLLLLILSQALTPNKHSTPQHACFARLTSGLLGSSHRGLHLGTVDKV